MSIIPDKLNGVNLAWDYKKFVPAIQMQQWQTRINEHTHDGTQGQKISHDNLENVRGPSSPSDAYHFPDKDAYDALTDSATGDSYPADSYHRHASDSIVDINLGYSYEPSDRNLSGLTMTEILGNAEVRSSIKTKIVDQLGEFSVEEDKLQNVIDKVTMDRLEVIRVYGHTVTGPRSGYPSPKNFFAPFMNFETGKGVLMPALLGPEVGYQGPYVQALWTPWLQGHAGYGGPVISEDSHSWKEHGNFVLFRTYEWTNWAALGWGTGPNIYYNCWGLGMSAIGCNGSYSNGTCTWNAYGLGWRID
jgi:hypothetical protein